MAMLVDFIKTYGQARRSELETLLINKLPDVLDDKQKKIKITNLMQALKKEGRIIKANTSDKAAIWIIPAL